MTLINQPSTNPNKALWEAITLVGILLLILLVSVCHLKGFFGGGDGDDEDGDGGGRGRGRGRGTGGGDGDDSTGEKRSRDRSRSRDQDSGGDDDDRGSGERTNDTTRTSDPSDDDDGERGGTRDRDGDRGPERRGEDGDGDRGNRGRGSETPRYSTPRPLNGDATTFRNGNDSVTLEGWDSTRPRNVQVHFHEAGREGDDGTPPATGTWFDIPPSPYSRSAARQRSPPREETPPPPSPPAGSWITDPPASAGVREPAPAPQPQPPPPAETPPTEESAWRRWGRRLSNAGIAGGLLWGAADIGSRLNVFALNDIEYNDPAVQSMFEGLRNVKKDPLQVDVDIDLSQKLGPITRELSIDVNGQKTTIPIGENDTDKDRITIDVQGVPVEIPRDYTTVKLEKEDFKAKFAVELNGRLEMVPSMAPKDIERWKQAQKEGRKEKHTRLVINGVEVFAPNALLNRDETGQGGTKVNVNVHNTATDPAPAQSATRDVTINVNGSDVTVPVIEANIGKQRVKIDVQGVPLEIPTAYDETTQPKREDFSSMLSVSFNGKSALVPFMAREDWFRERDMEKQDKVEGRARLIINGQVFFVPKRSNVAAKGNVEAGASNGEKADGDRVNVKVKVSKSGNVEEEVQGQLAETGDAVEGAEGEGGKRHERIHVKVDNQGTKVHTGEGEVGKARDHEAEEDREMKDKKEEGSKSKGQKMGDAGRSRDVEVEVEVVSPGGSRRKVKQKQDNGRGGAKEETKSNVAEKEMKDKDMVEQEEERAEKRSKKEKKEKRDKDRQRERDGSSETTEVVVEYDSDGREIKREKREKRNKEGREKTDKEKDKRRKDARGSTHEEETKIVVDVESGDKDERREKKREKPKKEKERANYRDAASSDEEVPADSERKRKKDNKKKKAKAGKEAEGSDEEESPSKSAKKDFKKDGQTLREYEERLEALEAAGKSDRKKTKADNDEEPATQTKSKKKRNVVEESDEDTPPARKSGKSGRTARDAGEDLDEVPAPRQNRRAPHQPMEYVDSAPTQPPPRRAGEGQAAYDTRSWWDQDQQRQQQQAPPQATPQTRRQKAPAQESEDLEDASYRNDPEPKMTPAQKAKKAWENVRPTKEKESMKMSNVAPEGDGEEVEEDGDAPGSKTKGKVDKKKSTARGAEVTRSRKGRPLYDPVPEAEEPSDEEEEGQPSKGPRRLHEKHLVDDIAPIRPPEEAPAKVNVSEIQKMPEDVEERLKQEHAKFWATHPSRGAYVNFGLGQARDRWIGPSELMADPRWIEEMKDRAGEYWDEHQTWASGKVLAEDEWDAEEHVEDSRSLAIGGGSTMQALPPAEGNTRHGGPQPGDVMESEPEQRFASLEDVMGDPSVDFKRNNEGPPRGPNSSISLSPPEQNASQETKPAKKEDVRMPFASPTSSPVDEKTPQVPPKPAALAKVEPTDELSSQSREKYGEVNEQRPGLVRKKSAESLHGFFEEITPPSSPETARIEPSKGNTSTARAAREKEREKSNQLPHPLSSPVRVNNVGRVDPEGAVPPVIKAAEPPSKTEELPKPLTEQHEDEFSLDDYMDEPVPVPSEARTDSSRAQVASTNATSDRRRGVAVDDPDLPPDVITDSRSKSEKARKEGQEETFPGLPDSPTLDRTDKTLNDPELPPSWTREQMKTSRAAMEEYEANPVSLPDSPPDTPFQTSAQRSQDQTSKSTDKSKMPSGDPASLPPAWSRDQWQEAESQFHDTASAPEAALPLSPDTPEGDASSRPLPLPERESGATQLPSPVPKRTKEEPAATTESAQPASPVKAASESKKKAKESASPDAPLPPDWSRDQWTEAQSEFRSNKHARTTAIPESPVVSEVSPLPPGQSARVDLVSEESEDDAPVKSTGRKDTANEPAATKTKNDRRQQGLEETVPIQAPQPQEASEGSRPPRRQRIPTMGSRGQETPPDSGNSVWEEEFARQKSALNGEEPGLDSPAAKDLPPTPRDSGYETQTEEEEAAMRRREGEKEEDGRAPFVRPGEIPDSPPSTPPGGHGFARDAATDSKGLAGVGDDDVDEPLRPDTGRSKKSQKIPESDLDAEVGNGDSDGREEEGGVLDKNGVPLSSKKEKKNGKRMNHEARPDEMGVIDEQLDPEVFRKAKAEEAMDKARKKKEKEEPKEGTKEERRAQRALLREERRAKKEKKRREAAGQGGEAGEPPKVGGGQDDTASQDARGEASDDQVTGDSIGTRPGAAPPQPREKTSRQDERARREKRDAERQERQKDRGKSQDDTHRAHEAQSASQDKENLKKVKENEKLQKNAERAVKKEEAQSDPSPGPFTVLRQLFHVLRHAPFFCLLTLGMIVLWIEGTRQIANLLILSTSSSSSAITKRAYAPDLQVTTSLMEKLLGNMAIRPVILFAFLNFFQFISILLVGLLLSTTISRSHRPKDPERKSWYRTPVASTRRAFGALTSSLKAVFCLRFFGAIVIATAFLGLMSFFADVVAYAMEQGVQAGSYNLSTVGANLILLIFILPLGWSLLVFWDCTRGIGSWSRRLPDTVGCAMCCGSTSHSKTNDSMA